MKKTLFILLTCALLGLTACLPQATQPNLSGIDSGLPVGAAVDEGSQETENESPSAGEVLPLPSADSLNPPADAPTYAYASDQPMPAGSVAPIHDPTGKGYTVLKGTSDVSCFMDDSERVRVEIKGFLRYVQPEVESLPDGGVRLSDGELTLLAGGGWVLRTIYTSGEDALFWDQLPAATGPGGIAVQGHSLGLVDFEVTTSAPDALRFFLVPLEFSPLSDDDPHASGSCGRDLCLWGLTGIRTVANDLTKTVPPDPLPECKAFRPKAAIMTR